MFYKNSNYKFDNIKWVLNNDDNEKPLFIVIFTLNIAFMILFIYCCKIFK